MKKHSFFFPVISNPDIIWDILKIEYFAFGGNGMVFISTITLSSNQICLKSLQSDIQTYKIQGNIIQDLRL